MIQTSQYSQEDHRKSKRQNNAGHWINPEYGYAKTNPKGKSLTAAFVAMAPIALALAIWFPFTPGGGIGSSWGNSGGSGHWDLATIGRAVLVCSAVISILAIILSCWRDG